MTTPPADAPLPWADPSPLTADDVDHILERLRFGRFAGAPCIPLNQMIDLLRSVGAAKAAARASHDATITAAMHGAPRISIQYVNDMLDSAMADCDHAWAYARAHYSDAELAPALGSGE